MFLGVFQFDGELADLLPAYERLMQTYAPDSLDLHICVQRDGGISVYDACPSRTDFEGFTGSSEFRSAVAEAGLPMPRIEAIGDVHAAHMREAARTRA